MFRAITNLVTTFLVLINTYYQFKTKKENKQLRKLYTVYFKVISIFLVLDNLFSFILRFIPFYQFTKMLLVIWLSVPQCSGAVFIYRFYVNGLFKAREKDLDNFINSLKTKFKESLGRYYELANGKYKEKKKSLFQKMKKEDNQGIVSHMNEGTEMTAGIKSTIKKDEESYKNEDLDTLVDDVDVEDSNMTLADPRD